MKVIDIIKEEVDKFINKYNLPQPTLIDSGSNMLCCMWGSEEDFYLYQPSICIFYKNKNLSATICNMNLGNLNHWDFRYGCKNNKELSNILTDILDEWAQRYWVKRI